MTKSLDEILISLEDICDKDVRNSENFGIEFGTYSPQKLKATSIKCIVTSPLMNLKLVHFMKENGANLAITLLPLSITETKFPLSERDFELLKALINNNIKTIQLPDEWIHSIKGSCAYFLQTLGLTNAQTNDIPGIFKLPIINWKIPSMSFNDFLANLGHLNKKWISYSFASEDSNLSFILEREELSSKELDLLRSEGVNTIMSFKIDSKKIPLYSSSKMNFIYIPYIDYCNIALRKFTQILQLEVGEQVLFHPLETKDGKNYYDYQNKT